MKKIVLQLAMCFAVATANAQWAGEWSDNEAIKQKYCEDRLREAPEGWGIKMESIEERFEEDFNQNPEMRNGFANLSLQFKANNQLLMQSGENTALGSWSIEARADNKTNSPYLHIKIGNAPDQTYSIIVLTEDKLLLNDENPNLQDQRMRLVEYEKRDSK